MAASTDASTATSINLERELVCFICTEILYQPLTLIGCLHSFCGACLKEWFSHQHRKATSSHSSSSSSANPYTCPTCRATVRDAQPNAMVNTLVDAFLTANPGRRRSDEEKQEMGKVYKPGDNILPKVEGRRRERRTRRDENAAETRERLMIEEARERSLRDMRAQQSTGQDTLQPPSVASQSQSSRSHDRGERRERRRDHDRQDRTHRSRTADAERAPEELTSVEQLRRESTSISAPVSSPRHPEAVEARQRQQTVVHQASLASLISTSDSGTGTGTGSGNTEEVQELMQEILAEGLGILRLEGLDVESLPENEQEALAERLVEAYRQRRRERNQRNNPSLDNAVTISSTTQTQASDNLQVEDRGPNQRTESGGRQRRADTVPSPAREPVAGERLRSARTQPMDSSNSLPPSSSVVLTHRRRTSSQGQRSDGSRNRSRQSSPTARSTDSRSHSNVDLATRSGLRDTTGTTIQPSSNVNQRPVDLRSSPQNPEAQVQNTPRPEGATSGELSGPADGTVTQAQGSSRPPLDMASQNTRQSNSHSTFHTGRRTSGLFDEPVVSCFRCHKADIQYEVYRHCDGCDVDLCARCYRAGRGCKHWYGFGHSAMAQFESMRPASHEQMELPHTLSVGRQYKRPEDHTIVRSKLAKDGTTVVALQTTSDPASRFQEGRFCDRCSSFASSLFWSCDYCNYGEWGFCRDCVNTHHCCTHPLLPSAHKSFAPTPSSPKLEATIINPTSSELLGANLRSSPNPSQPSSATSAISTSAGPFPDFINLVITTSCDICHQSILPSAYRFHCPAHPSPTATNPDAKGDYDICTPCYQNLVKTNRIKRDDGSAGWRKCPSGHRMIITTFYAVKDGGQRRVVIHDLVGGWKSIEEATSDWHAELEARREQGTIEDPSSPTPGSPDSSTARRLIRARTSSYPHDPNSSNGASPYNSSSRFPPDGGTGLRGVAWWSYFLDDMDKGPNDLCFPAGAEIREVRINEEYPDWCGGVYAGDRGLLPASYLRI